jgi:hypothetical protein
MKTIAVLTIAGSLLTAACSSHAAQPSCSSPAVQGHLVSSLYSDLFNVTNAGRLMAGLKAHGQSLQVSSDAKKQAMGLVQEKIRVTPTLITTLGSEGNVTLCQTQMVVTEQGSEEKVAVLVFYKLAIADNGDAYVQVLRGKGNVENGQVLVEMLQEDNLNKEIDDVLGLNGR